MLVVICYDIELVCELIRRTEKRLAEKSPYRLHKFAGSTIPADSNGEGEKSGTINGNCFLLRVRKRQSTIKFEYRIFGVKHAFVITRVRRNQCRKKQPAKWMDVGGFSFPRYRCCVNGIVVVPSVGFNLIIYYSERMKFECWENGFSEWARTLCSPVGRIGRPAHDIFQFILIVSASILSLLSNPIQSESDFFAADFVPAFALFRFGWQFLLGALCLPHTISPYHFRGFRLTFPVASSFSRHISSLAGFFCSMIFVLYLSRL